MPSRRNFLRTFGFASAGALASPRTAEVLLPKDGRISYVRNDALKTILPEYAGNAMMDGRFLNEGLASSDKSFGTVFKWFLSENPQKIEKKNDPWRPDVRRLPDLSSITEDVLIWLGHASFLIHFHGRWILTDPCLTHPPFQARLAELPLTIDQLSVVNYVLISHGHYDHLDADTMEELPCRRAVALLPLRMAPLIRSMNKYLDTVEAGWYQEYPLDEPFRIYFVPAQHWYLRVPWDRNRILWGGFLIESEKSKIFFAGDTAYAGHFETIARSFSPIDYCLMPIGAYKPPYIMKASHTNPAEAVQAFHELGGRNFIPMHFGTFDLADEPIGEPLRWLRRLADAEQIKGQLLTPAIGEIVTI